jgi:hypothetical protein
MHGKAKNTKKAAQLDLFGKIQSIEVLSEQGGTLAEYLEAANYLEAEGAVRQFVQYTDVRFVIIGRIVDEVYDIAIVQGNKNCATPEFQAALALIDKEGNRLIAYDSEYFVRVTAISDSLDRAYFESK